MHRREHGDHRVAVNGLGSSLPFDEVQQWAKMCGCSSVVEHRVANAKVMGSTPITRSFTL